MDAFVIEGGRRLEGRLRVHGSKNSALPIMAAVLLTDEPVTLRDVPDLSDIRNMVRLLGELGIMIARETDDQRRPIFALHAIDNTPVHARYDIVRTMRASICVLGPLLAKRGRARVSLPGGCAIGQRPVDLHLRGLEALGAEITLEGGDIVAEAPGGRLKGGTVFLGGANGSTVLGTANVMSAATLAQARPSSSAPPASPRSSTWPTCSTPWARGSRARARPASPSAAWPPWAGPTTRSSPTASRRAPSCAPRRSPGAI